MSDIKMFYTENELKKMGADELLALTTFGTGEDIYYYSDIETLSVIDGEMSILFKNKETVFTDSADTFESVKLGKARYALLSKTFESTEDSNQREQMFYNSITAKIETELEDLRKQGADNAQNNRNIVTNLENTMAKAISDMQKAVQASSASMADSMTKSVKVWNKQVKELDKFNTEAYEVKMKNVDKIISAFDELLEK